MFEETFLIYKTVWDSINGNLLLSQSVFYLKIVWETLRTWWWFIAAIILVKPFLFLWLWWRRQLWYDKLRYVVLDIKIPKEVLKPLRAMEQAFSSIWGGLYDPPDWWEKWIDGVMVYSISLEIASIEGQPHFFIRVPEKSQKAIESAIYAQYPEAEISAVDDYAKNIPRDIPNKNWDMWGCDWVPYKPDVYPIKTYSKFFEEKPDAPKEEKRLDPLSTLLEGMGKIGPGEQFWIQMGIQPVTNDENDFTARGRKIADKIARREEEKQRSVEMEAAELIILGKEPEEEKRLEIIPPEMKLTPGEREILAGIEEKIGKYMFKTYIRFIYLAKRDAFYGPARAIAFSFFQQFGTTNLNALIPASRTLTKVHKHWFLPINLLYERRLYIKKRWMLRNYLMRLSPLFPLHGLTYVMNIEEMATLFHFPGKMVAPAPFVSRVEIKRGEAPPGLPIG